MVNLYINLRFTVDTEDDAEDLVNDVDNALAAEGLSGGLVEYEIVGGSDD